MNQAQHKSSARVKTNIKNIKKTPHTQGATPMLNSRRWFLLCLVYVSYLVLVAGVARRRKYMRLKLGGGQAYNRSSD
jgi:hypothetical protein